MDEEETDHCAYSEDIGLVLAYMFVSYIPQVCIKTKFEIF